MAGPSSSVNWKLEGYDTLANLQVLQVCCAAEGMYVAERVFFSLGAMAIIAASCAGPAPAPATAVPIATPPERPEPADAGAIEPDAGALVPLGKTIDSSIGKIPSQADLDEVFSAGT